MWRTAIAASSALILIGCGGGANLRQGGMLVSCEGSSNCLSTQSAAPGDHIDVITYAGTRTGAQQLMVSILVVTEGVKLVQQEDGYIHATYTSDTLGFVEDLELVFPAEKKIDMRIASRAAHLDLGANRKRIEALRKSFYGLQP